MSISKQNFEIEECSGNNDKMSNLHKSLSVWLTFKRMRWCLEECERSFNAGRSFALSASPPCLVELRVG